jgi:hypothetical protein
LVSIAGIVLGNYTPRVKTLLLLFFVAFLSYYLSFKLQTEKPATAPAPIEQTRDPIKICSDPKNFGYHSIGHEEGMCMGFAINLMHRLNREADVTNAWIMTMVGIGNPEPDKPESENRWFIRRGKTQGHGMGFWGHAVVLFTTFDHKMYAMDENVNAPIEVNINKLDFTDSDPMSNFPEMVIRDLWADGISKYPIAWEKFRVSSPHFIYGKQDVFDDFCTAADVYFTMQNHAYYFPPDYCVD